MERAFRRDLGALEEIVAFVDAFFAAERISEENGFKVNLILEELFTNMVKYSTESDRDIEIALERGPMPNSLALILTDHDVDGYDPNQAGEVDVQRPLAERRAGGLGIHLVRRLVERIDYEYGDRVSRTTVVVPLENADV